MANFDFKKSCATFSSTLRHFQDDFQFSGGAVSGATENIGALGSLKSNLQGQDQNELEESI